MSQIDNKTAKKFNSQMLKFGCLPVGSYSRDSTLPFYNDLDYITFRNLNDVYKDIYNTYDNLAVVKQGNKYMQIIIDGYQLDFWHGKKNNFYRDYLNHSIKTEKLIFINKFLKNN